jgi:hypothetical protein
MELAILPAVQIILNNYFKNVKLMLLQTFILMKTECKSYTVFYASQLTHNILQFYKNFKTSCPYHDQKIQKCGSHKASPHPQG